MEIEVKDYVIRHTVIDLTGRIDAFNVATLRDRFTALADTGGKRFIVDLSNVSFLDSAGMAALVSLLKRARQAGGDVDLVWPKLEAAKRILQLTKFDRVFNMLDSAENGIPSDADFAEPMLAVA